MSTILTPQLTQDINDLGAALEIVADKAQPVLDGLVPLYARNTGSPATLTDKIRTEAPGLAQVFPLGGRSMGYVLDTVCKIAALQQIQLPVEFVTTPGLASSLKKDYDDNADAFRAKFAKVTTTAEMYAVAKAIQDGPAEESDESGKTKNKAAAKTAAKVTAQIAAVTKSLGKLESVTQTEAAALVAAAKALVKAAESVKVEKLAIEAAPAA